MDNKNNINFGQIFILNNYFYQMINNKIDKLKEIIEGFQYYNKLNNLKKNK